MSKPVCAPFYRGQNLNLPAFLESTPHSLKKLLFRSEGKLQSHPSPPLLVLGN